MMNVLSSIILIAAFRTIHQLTPITVAAFTITAATTSNHLYYPISSFAKQLSATTTSLVATSTGQSIQEHNTMLQSSSSTNQVIRSLCGPYVIQSIVTSNQGNRKADPIDGLFRLQFILTSLENDPLCSTPTATAIHAWRLLQPDYNISSPTSSTTIDLMATWNPTLHVLQIGWTTDEDHDTIDSEMMAILSRVLVQYSLSTWYQDPEQSQLLPLHRNVTIQIGSQEPIHVPLPTSISSFGNDCLNNDPDPDYLLFVRTLFQGLSIDTAASELVEMVYVNCQYNSQNAGHGGNDHFVLGVVPRHWVHQFNLLHRGIGVLVTKDRPIIGAPSASLLQQQQPDLYCHKRTSTKRIFPSLYDMFIGGVSAMGESSVTTALREVSEELGVTTIDPNRLSPRMFQCVVCTAYNRCIVDVFGYAMNTTTDHIVWQEEEVEWGAFVPYNIVEAAAQLSIHRLQDNNKWPGRYNIDRDTISPSGMSIAPGTRSVTDSLRMVDEWKVWDFVPDGLLVWESWLHEQQDR